MRSWVYRNRETLERVYGTPARLHPLTEPDEAAPGRRSPSAPAPRLVIYHLAPQPPRPLRQAG